MAQTKTVQCGIDLVSLDRFERLVQARGDAVLRRVFTPSELAGSDGRIKTLAATLAGKEAVAKMLGTGIDGFGWQDIEIAHGAPGAPDIHLSGGAARRARALGIHDVAISFSYEDGIAAAVVVALLPQRPEPQRHRARPVGAHHRPR